MPIRVPFVKSTASTEKIIQKIYDYDSNLETLDIPGDVQRKMKWLLMPDCVSIIK